MKNFFRSAGLLIKSFPQILVFELLYKLILSAFGAPLLNLLLRIAMNSAGVAYLSFENIVKLLLHPLTWVIFLAILLLVAFFSVIELSALTLCYSCRISQRKIKISDMLISGVRIFSKNIRMKDIPRLIGFVFIIPMIQLTLSSGIFFAPLTPMVQRVSTLFNPVLCVILAILVAILLLIFLSDRCYCIHFLMLTDYSFADSLKKSRQLLSDQKLRIFLGILWWSILLAAMAAIVTFVPSFIVLLLRNGLSQPNEALLSALSILRYAGKIFAAVSSVIAAPVLMCFITSKFFDDVKDSETLQFPKQEREKLPRSLKIFLAISLSAVCIFLNFSYIKGIYRGNIGINLGVFSMPQLTAHRGYSYVAPENTYYSFEEAINIGTDYIELDVQQSSDGQLVVIHDSTLDRTTNGIGNVSDYSYSELSDLSAGSWFKKGDFSDAKIMLLSEVLEMADNNIMLNIEIKDSGDVKDTARKTAEMLDEYNFTDSCYVTSFSYPALETVKKTNKSIKTALIANIASTAVLSQLKYIDAISVNYLFVNQNTVTEAHKCGKDVFVWTVNSRDDIERMIDIGVDNIITDRPDIAMESVYSYGKSDFALVFLKKIFGV